MNHEKPLAQGPVDVNVRRWMPIATAPKDGSKFIGLCGELVYTIYRQKYYDKWPHQDGGPTYTEGWSAETWDQHMPCSPTFWMPQPEAPNAEFSGRTDELLLKPNK